MDFFLKYSLFAVIIVFLIWFFFRRKKNTAEKTSKNNETEQVKSGRKVRTGNICVFFDNDLNATIIPYVKSLDGIGMGTLEIIKLKNGYTMHDLGNQIKDSMEVCDLARPAKHEDLMHELGYRNWAKFTEDKKNISIHYNKSTGLVLSSTFRKEDGSYDFTYPRSAKVLPSDINEEELGKAVLEHLKKCRL
jgi:hypothetical protein